MASIHISAVLLVMMTMSYNDYWYSVWQWKYYYNDNGNVTIPIQW